MFRSPRRLILAATALAVVFGWASAAAADLKDSENAYFSCVRINTMAELVKGKTVSRDLVAAAVDTAMTACKAKFNAYQRDLVDDTLVRNGWQAPHQGALTRFEAKAPEIIRQRFIDYFAQGL